MQRAVDRAQQSRNHRYFPIPRIRLSCSSLTIWLTTDIGQLPVFGYSIYEAYHTGKYLDIQFFNQPWYVLYEDTKKSSREIFWCKFLCIGCDGIKAMSREVTHGKMFIHDLASLEVRMVEMHYASWFSSITTDVSRDPNK
jgi:hypothetical protein